MTKQYLLMCDDRAKPLLERLLCADSIQFLEVQGMTMNGNAYNVLVTPVLPPVNPMPVATPPASPEQPVEQHEA